MKYFVAGWILALVVSIHTWLFWGEYRFYAGLSSITVDEQDRPALFWSHSKGLGVNTYEDDLTPDSIRRSYTMACRRLETIRGRYPRTTYSWEDDETWPSVSSVVQFPTGYIEVHAYQGNDSDGVWIRVSPGAFPISGKNNLKTLLTDDLPPGTLRP